MYQKLILIGRLGRDPEMRYTTDGTPVTSFSVATDRKWTDASGQAQSKTTWFKVSAWRRLAETCNQYLTKGQLVYIEGEISEPRVWQGKDGQSRASLEVTAQNVKFLGGRPGGASAEAGASAGAPAGESAPPPAASDEEEIPF
jgi:single-strand DNA-binding protein